MASSARSKLQRHPGTLPPADRSGSIRPPDEGSVAEPASTVPVTRTASLLASVRIDGSALGWTVLIAVIATMVSLTVEVLERTVWPEVETARSSPPAIFSTTSTDADIR